MRLQDSSDGNRLHAAVKVDMTHKYDSFIVLDPLERNQSSKKDHLHHFCLFWHDFMIYDDLNYQKWTKNDQFWAKISDRAINQFSNKQHV